MTHYQLVAQNKRRSWFIIAAFVLIVIGLGWLLTYALGYDYSLLIPIALVGSAGSIISYWFSDKIVLGISGAREASRKEFFDFYTVAENLAMSQQLSMPKLYVIDDSSMNAFATGRDPQHAVVCATTGLLSRLSRPEIEGVIAHELAHVRNYDIRLMSLVSVLVGFVVLLADWMLRSTFWGGRRDSDSDRGGNAIVLVIAMIAAIITPLVAELIKLAISRSREFVADADGVAMTKNPQGLINALEKLGSDREPLEAANKATAHLYIVSPLANLKGQAGIMSSLFSTHPPLADRIAALRKLTI